MTEKFNAANTSFLFGLSHRRKVFLVNLYMLSNTLLDPNILSRVDKNSSEYNGEKLAEKEDGEENLFRLLRTKNGDKHLLSMKQVLLDEYGGSIDKLKEAFKSTENSDKDDIEKYFSEIKEKAPKEEVEKKYYGISKDILTSNLKWDPDFLAIAMKLKGSNSELTNLISPPGEGYIEGSSELGYKGKDIITGEQIKISYLRMKNLTEEEFNIHKERLTKNKKDAEAPGEAGEVKPVSGAAVEAPGVDGVTEGDGAKGVEAGAEVTEGAPVDKADQQKKRMEEQRLMKENGNNEELEIIKDEGQTAAETHDDSLKTKKNRSKQILQTRLTKKKNKKAVQTSVDKFKRNRETRKQAKETAENLVGNILKSPPSSENKGNRRTNENIGNTLTSSDDSNLETQQNEPQRRYSVGGSRKK